MLNHDCTVPGCGKRLSTVGALKRHQKSAACMKLQGKPMEKEFACSKCNKKFSRADNCADHNKECKVKTDNATIMEELAGLRNDFAAMRNSPTFVQNNYTNNNTTNNNFSKEAVTRAFLLANAPINPGAFRRNATSEEIIKGGEAIGNYIGEMVGDRIILVNEKEKTITYSNESGQRVNDKNMAKLLSFVSCALLNQGAKEICATEGVRIASQANQYNMESINTRVEKQVDFRILLGRISVGDKPHPKGQAREYRYMRDALIKYLETPDTYRLKMENVFTVVTIPPQSENNTPEEALQPPLLAILSEGVIVEEEEDESSVLSEIENISLDDYTQERPFCSNSSKRPSDEDEEDVSLYSIAVPEVEEEVVINMDSEGEEIEVLTDEDVEQAARKENCNDSEYSLEMICGIKSYESLREKGRRDSENIHLYFKQFSKYTNE
jgi:hypothetical protein